MKEDAQLICPISYHDPSGIVWSKLQQRIQERLPLRDVSWKGTGNTSISQGTVHRLPLRFMPSTASLFKDTDHPFRWFLAPYGNIYFVNVDTLEAYKDAKPAIKKWVETVLGLKRASWLLVYVPISASDKVADVAICGKVFAKLCSDFYVERAGDRSVNFISVATTASSSISDESAPASAAYDELFNKVKEGIMASFAQRSGLYDSDIRRLDSFRGSVQFDFRQLFLVKESLALMYQLMQLPQEALRQYGELEALLGMVPEGTLLSNDWPLAISEDLREAARGAINSPTFTPDSQPLLTDVSCDSVVTVLTEFEELWHDPLQEGENVLLYSINSVRMRILKNKIGTRELRRYVFSRQMHFLAQQLKCREFASKGSQYVTDTYNGLLVQLSEQVPVDVKRKQQADLWALTAAVKIASTCRAHLRTQCDHLASVSASSPGKSSGRGILLLPGSKVEAVGSAGAVSTGGGGGGPSEAMESVLRKKIAQSRELQLLKDSALPLTELLNLAASTLHSFCLAPDSHSFPVLRCDSRGLLSHDLSDTHTLNSLRKVCTAHSDGRKSNPYREYALSLSLSPPVARSGGPPELLPCSRMSGKELGQGQGQEDRGNDGKEQRQDKKLSPRMSALQLRHPGGRSVEVSMGSLSAVVQEAIRAESDKALLLFLTSLRIILSREEDEVEGLGSILGPELAQGQGLAPWCPLFVLLLRSLAQHEELGGRYRTASRSRLACADVLLCHGHYALASDTYFEAIRNGAGIEEGMVVGMMGCGTLWAKLRHSVLLKILHCASALRCKHTCIRAALLLFASKCAPSEPDFSTTDMSTLSASDKVIPVGTGVSRDNEGTVYTFLPYFEIETESFVVREEPSKLPLPPVCSSAEADVRDRIEVSTEGDYSIGLNIVSHFPCAIELDEVCIIYEASPSLAGHNSHVEGMDADEGMRMGNARSFTAACHTMGSNATITLNPGVSHALLVPFSAPVHYHSYDSYAVVQVKAVIRGRKVEHAPVGEEVAGFMGMETISFVQKIAQFSGDSTSSKDLTQLTPRTSVSTSYPDLQGRGNSVTTGSFIHSLPLISVTRASQVAQSLSQAASGLSPCLGAGAGVSDQALIDGVDLRMRTSAIDDGNLEQHTSTDKKVLACPIVAYVSTPVITPPITSPQPAGTVTSEPPSQGLNFLVKINLHNVSSKAVRIAGVTLYCSDFELSDILDNLSCVCDTNTSCNLRLTRTWNSLVLLPGERYSALLYYTFTSKILATDVAPATSLASAQCIQEEAVLGSTTSKADEGRKPRLIFSCDEEDVSSMPSSGPGSTMSTGVPNLVVCLQSTCRLISQDLWHTIASGDDGKDGSDYMENAISVNNSSFDFTTRLHVDQTQQGSRQVDGAGAGVSGPRRHYERERDEVSLAAETSQIQRQRVLTKAVKTDRLILSSRSSWL